MPDGALVMNYDDLNPEVRKLVDAADAKAQGKPDPHEPQPYADEAEFQRDAERWLELIGFRRRTPQEIQRHHKGLWYVHLNRTKDNPILCDLVLIDSRGGPYEVRAIEIELKCEETQGRLSVEQNCLAQRNEVVVCWTLEQVQEAVGLWRLACRKEQP